MFDHLKKTDLSYCAHMKQALGYSRRLQICVVKLLLHAIVPNLYTSDVSSEINNLNKEMHRE